MDNTTPPPRKVSFILGLGIFLMPYLFSWVLLKKGYSSTAKGVSFTWMILMLFIMLQPNEFTLDESTQELSETAAAVVQTQAPAPALEVNAAQLWSDYHDNEVAADDVYKGRTLLVKGAVYGIEKDMFGNIIVRLQAPNEFMSTMATLEDSEKGIAAKLKKGQPIALRCVGAGMVIGSPSLKSCVVD